MKRILSLLSLMLFVLVAIPATAQEKESYSSTDVFSIYLKGGLSRAFGLGFQNVNPPLGLDYSQAVGGGVSYEFSRSVRLSANYEFTKLKREQRLNKFEPTAPKLNGPGATYSGGTAYREMWSHFNNAELALEYNFSNLMPALKRAGVNFYLGTGVGGMFVYGNKYAISMAHEELFDLSEILNGTAPAEEWVSETWFAAENDRHNYKALYVPASFNAEFVVNKTIALGLRCGYKFIFTEEAAAPKGLLDAAVVLRFRLF